MTEESEPQPRPTRMVFADTIQEGMIIVQRCLMTHDGTVLTAHTHQLQVIDVRHLDSLMRAIVIDETGEQDSITTLSDEILRVVV